MTLENAAPAESFSGRVMNFLDSITYRRIESDSDLREVGMMRLQAYKAANILSLGDDPLIDAEDFDRNAFVFGIYQEGCLISTVRLHYVTPEHRVSTTRNTQPAELDSFLDRGKTLIDPVRLASDMETLRNNAAMPYLTLRLASMACDFFDADHVVQFVAPEHAAFYKRVYKAKEILPPDMNRGKYTIPLTLMVTDCRDIRDWLYKRYPFFMAHPDERARLFDRSFASAHVAPTARACIESGLGYLPQREGERAA